MIDRTLLAARPTGAVEDASARVRLVRRLEGGAGGPLTLVSGPAGAGKSALLRQWLRRVDGPTGLVTLRRDETVPTLLARLLPVLRDLGAAVPRSGLDPAPTTLDARTRTWLVDRMRPLRDGVLVIDAFDAPEDRLLANDLAAVLAAAPPSLHLALATRSRTPALREVVAARPPEVVLGEADLRFTVEEARALTAAFGTVLTEAQGTALVARTEGWAVGLQVAAVALRTADDVDATIAAFGGDDRHVAAFLLDEVLSHESEPVRRFLLETSVLDQLSPRLCAAVARDGNRRGLLPLLERRGLFLRREAPHSPWFRYAALFRDALRQELRRVDPAAENVLLGRAAAWHAARGDGAEAARYLIEADDQEALLAVIDRVGGTMFEQGRAAEVLGWLDAVREVRPSDTGLALRRAYLHTMVGETRRAEHVVREARARRLCPGEEIAVDALRATWGLWHARPDEVIEAADAVLAGLNTVDAVQIPDIFGLTSPTSLRLMAAGSRARARWHLGDVDGARHDFTALMAAGHAYAPWRLHVIGALALLEAWAGNLHRAHQHARHALTGADTVGLARHPCTHDARLALAHVALEHNHVRRAGDLLDELETLVPPQQRPVTAAHVAIERMRWHLAAGRPHAGLATLETYRSSGLAPAPPVAVTRMAAAEVRCLVALGDVARARSVHRAAASEQPMTGADLLLAGVQAAVVAEDLADARRLLSTPGAAGTCPGDRLGHALWSAIVELEDGDRRRGIRLAASVVHEAVREEHVRLFLDAGAPAVRVLRLVDHAVPSPYVTVLLAAAEADVNETAGHGLSERELEVLRYLPMRLSNAEIAAQLFVSLNTLKTHLRAIYRKLEVGGRTEAVRRAAELGIV